MPAIMRVLILILESWIDSMLVMVYSSSSFETIFIDFILWTLARASNTKDVKKKKGPLR